MFPISDDNPRVHTPVATMAIIGLNVAVWAFLQGFGSPRAIAESLCFYALVPGELLGYVPPGTQIPVSAELYCRFDGTARPWSVLTSMFMHGGWFHIIGNMWFLWIFGDNVEDEMGPLRFTLFYLLCGAAAAAAQVVSDPDSLIPMVGASGAIGGVMGAYALLHPRAHVTMLVFLGILITTVKVPAIFMLGYWFLLQLLQGIPALGSGEGGVAFWAHAGGFVAGLALVWVFRHRHRGGGRRPPSGSTDRWF